MVTCTAARWNTFAIEVGGVELMALLGFWPIDGNSRPPSFLGHEKDCTQCYANNRHGLLCLDVLAHWPILCTVHVPLHFGPSCLDHGIMLHLKI